MGRRSPGLRLVTTCCTRFPSTGTRPITYGATQPADGLTLDAATGIIRGTIAHAAIPGDVHREELGRLGAQGVHVVAEDSRPHAGDGVEQLERVRPRGQRSLARAAADAMVSKGLIDHGWTYVNLDDGWERSAREADPLFEGPVRAPDGTMLTNKKFPDMKALGDYMHAKGSSSASTRAPVPRRVSVSRASWQHQQQDF